MTMTNEEYLKHGHEDFCPGCESANVKHGTIQADGGLVWQDIVCQDCDLWWNDYYTLAGYQVINP